MLSPDELENGIVFILKLLDPAGTPIQWVQTLHGYAARRWYDIYQRSDWAALRIEAADIFFNSVSEDEAERVRRHARCIVIHTLEVSAGELAARHESFKTALLAPADVERQNRTFSGPMPESNEFKIRQL